MIQAVLNSIREQRSLKSERRTLEPHPAGEQLGGWRLCGRDRERDRTDEPPDAESGTDDEDDEDDEAEEPED